NRRAATVRERWMRCPQSAPTAPFRSRLIGAMAIALLCGCASKSKPPATTLPSVAPASQPSVSLSLNGAEIRPMYRELLAIDLPTVARVAMAQSIDIEEARQRVQSARGRHEASGEALCPGITPALTYRHDEG